LIREEELLEAIAECQGQRNPNANTCIKLASYYTILDHLEEKEEKPMYSYAAPPAIERTPYTSDTEFGQRIQSLNTNDVLAVMDELMTTLSIINPRLYDGVMAKL